MTTKKLLLAGAALSFLAFSSTGAEAKERLSIHELNNFVASLTNAVNNPDPAVGRTFLARHLGENAQMNNTILHAHAAVPNMMHPAWQGYATSHYYRYPYAANPYYKPTSVRSMDKTEIIAQFESKKHMIPRYNQKIEILGSKMPADGRNAVLDVNMKEFGVAYRYGYNPYAPHHANQYLHTVSSCQLFIEKEKHDVRLNRINCNTTMNPVF